VVCNPIGSATSCRTCCSRSTERAKPMTSRSFSAWVVTISQRRAIDLLRQRGRHDRREVYAPVEYESHTGENVYQGREVTLERQGNVLEAALSSLPSGSGKPLRPSLCANSRSTKLPMLPERPRER